MDRVAFSIFGIDVMWYGILMASGMILGTIIALKEAKRVGISEDSVLDLAIIAIPMGLLGARLYYVLFNWGYYSQNPSQILNFRGGGMAIHGAIIAGLLTGYIFTKIKKINFLKMADTVMIGMPLAQAIGRWGNFFNCEAFGGYTDSLFAMRIRRALVNESMISQDLLNHLIVKDGVEYIQVHPTFLYESVWNLGVLAFMLWYRKRKKFNGEMLLIYLLGYGLGRVWIEGLRTDQLIFFNTGIAVSQALSLVLVVISALVLIWKHRQIRLKSKGED